MPHMKNRLSSTLGRSVLWCHAFHALVCRGAFGLRAYALLPNYTSFTSMYGFSYIRSICCYAYVGAPMPKAQARYAFICKEGVTQHKPDRPRASDR